MRSVIFVFLKQDRPQQEYFEFGEPEEWPFHSPERVVMFSGGLDSLAGAVETARNGSRLVLVSHRPVTTLSSRQKQLFHELQKEFPDQLLHVPVWINKDKRFGQEPRNTVRAWVKAGLPICDSKRPTLVLGRDLAAYLHARRTKNKQLCKPGEIYCVRCRAPKRPAGEMAEYKPITETLGNLMGICPDCNGMIYRRSSWAKLAVNQGNLDITFSEVERQVSEMDSSTLNSDFSQG
ncbi:MAG: hypothetical protein ACLQMO_10635 [Acidobacteriaceae bacterium]